MFYIFVILSLSFVSCMQAEALEEVESTLGVEVVLEKEEEVEEEKAEEDLFYFTIYNHNEESGSQQIKFSEMMTRFLIYTIILRYDENIKLFFEKHPNIEKVFEYVEVKHDSVTIKIFEKTF